MGNHWSDYFSMDVDGDGIGDTPYVIDENNQDNYPLLHPWGTPEVTLLNVENALHPESFPLNFSVSKPAQWIGYSLDGDVYVSVNGNTTLSGLVAGLHNVTVFAIDIYGSSGASKTVNFTIIEPSIIEPFPTALVITASGASAAIIGLGLLVYFRKRKR